MVAIRKLYCCAAAPCAANATPTATAATVQPLAAISPPLRAFFGAEARRPSVEARKLQQLDHAIGGTKSPSVHDATVAPTRVFGEEVYAQCRCCRPERSEGPGARPYEGRPHAVPPSRGQGLSRSERNWRGIQDAVPV